MNIEEIMMERQSLENDLKAALSTMEKKDAIFLIKDELKELQLLCPHSTRFNKNEENKCPYCGKEIG